MNELTSASNWSKLPKNKVRDNYLVSQENTEILAYLKEITHIWGGSFVQMTDSAFDVLAGQQEPIDDGAVFSPAPFTSEDLAVNHKQKILYFVETMPWPNIVHEMAHIFACHEQPNMSEEFDFLGWEFAMAEMLRDKFGHSTAVKAWMFFNADYGLSPNGDDMATMNVKEVSMTLRERLDYAEANRLILNRIPQAIR